MQESTLIRSLSRACTIENVPVVGDRNGRLNIGVEDDVFILIDDANPSTQV